MTRSLLFTCTVLLFIINAFSCEAKESRLPADKTSSTITLRLGPQADNKNLYLVNSDHRYIPENSVRLKKIRVRKPAPTRKIFLGKIGYIEIRSYSPFLLADRDLLFINYFDFHISALLNLSLELRNSSLLI